VHQWSCRWVIVVVVSVASFAEGTLPTFMAGIVLCSDQKYY
jgi:hypothetical protein